MNVKVHELDLTTLSVEERVDKLYDLLVNHNASLQFVLSSDPKETMLMQGCVPVAFSYYGIKNREPLIAYGANDPQVVRVFLSHKLRETSQAIFVHKINKNSPIDSRFDRVRTTDKIDWFGTIIAVLERSPDAITLKESEGDIYDKETVTSVEGVPYSVRVDSMGLNPDNDENVACEKAILDLYNSLYASQ